MKIIKLHICAFFIGLLALTSCDITDDTQTCIATIYAPATEVTGPATATINQEVDFAVKFKIENSCGSFLGFAESTATPKQIAATVRYDGCDCNEVVTNVTKNYKFKATVAGEYTLKFLTANSQYITKTITVTP